ncbi:MAG: hypothetical protein JKY16_03465 [Lutibacter sp.]|nr:hypothetical protein [Lutibacter sp.]
MKIRYKRLHLRGIFIFGLFWLILGIISITNDSENYFNYGYLLASLLYFGNYLFKSKNQYLTIEEGSITLNNLFSQSINLEELKRVKIKGKVYILQTERSELQIKTNLIDKNSLKDFKAILKSLKLKK